MNWEKGFEAGVAFTLRHFTLSGASTFDVTHFILQLEHLRTWKSPEEWRELVEKNIVLEDNDG